MFDASLDKSKSKSKHNDDNFLNVVKSYEPNGKLRLSDNFFAEYLIPKKKIKIKKNDKKTKTKSVDKVSQEMICLSSDSDEESDASASEFLIKNNKKRKKINRSRSINESETSEDDKVEDLGIFTERRKNIRKIISKSKLSDVTKIAEQQEIERRKRMEEKQRMYNTAVINEYASFGNRDTLILEKDQNGDTIVAVHEYIAKKLKPHQLEAVTFMYECVIENVQSLHKSQEDGGYLSSSVGGCILAHCMGLGKTLSLVAFIHTMLTTDILNLYSCIIVCPVNTAVNWKKEWDMWMPRDRSVNIFELCGNEPKKDKISVVQEWFEKEGVLIISYEMYRLLVSGDSRVIHNNTVRKKMFEALVDPGADFIVCDEGHLLKNDKSTITKVINQVRTRCRIVLTGTPLQNRLVEYHTMINFVKPNLLGTQKEFLNRFVNPISNGQHIDSTAHDVEVMKKRSHVLTKTLAGCVHRKDYSALEKYLPPKYEYVIKIRLSEIQISLYKAYLSNLQAQKRSLFQDQAFLARIWTHPFLVCMYQEMEDNKRFVVDSDEESLAHGSDNDADEGLQKDVNENEIQQTEESFVISLLSDDSNDNDKKEEMEKEQGDFIEILDSSGSEQEVTRKWNMRTRKKVKDSKEDSDKCMLESVRKGIVDGKYWWSGIIVPENEQQIEISGKLTILFQILSKASAIGDKVIVFSHSLLTLDIIEKYLAQLHIKSQVDKHGLKKEEIGYSSWEKSVDYERMDGSTNVFNRADIQERFNSDREDRLRLFLISTRAGGIGVNLVAANRVVIFDVSWNPSNDMQAIFRSYRFGQMKPVYVYRLVSLGTMEEKIYERQVSKQSLSLRVVDEQQIGRFFTEEDLNALYKFEPHVFNENDDTETLQLPKDRFLAEMIQKFPQWIYGYHEHDSLLKNKDDEELTESEQQEAWKEFEEEKLRADNFIISGFNESQFAQLQMSLAKEQFPEYISIFAQNYPSLFRQIVAVQPDLVSVPDELSRIIQNVFLKSLQT